MYKDGDERRLDAVIASFICAAMRGRLPVQILDDQTGGLSHDAAKGIRLQAPALEDWTQWADALVYVPASLQARRQRGFDHMESIAELCGQRTGLDILSLLSSTRRTLDQRRLTRSERQANRRASFAISPEALRTRNVPGRIILIDDVLTTGATLSAATEALLEEGAREIRAVTCARVW